MDPKKRKRSTIAHTIIIDEEHKTNFAESITHLVKGNVGAGIYALGEAFKNGGLIVSSILLLFIAIMCVHCQHLMLKCSDKVREQTLNFDLPDYAETVEDCFKLGPPKFRAWSAVMKIIANVFICITQLGFCCIYLVFISSNFQQLLEARDMHYDMHSIMLVVAIPVWLLCLITSLKFLAPVSGLANICMITGLVITMYYAFQGGLPSPSERNYYTNVVRVGLFFGTALFAFESVALVLPLKNAMKEPYKFSQPCGVLNVGMFLVAIMYFMAGFIGYLKWGEEVGASLTLNLPQTGLGESVKLMVSFGILMTYPLQFFVAIQIMYPGIKDKFNLESHPLIGELFFRTFLVGVTLIIAELVPHLSLLLSLIGAVAATTLALVFPPIIQLIIRTDGTDAPGYFIYVKNITILIVAMLGCVVGSYESISAIIAKLLENE